MAEQLIEVRNPLAAWLRPPLPAPPRGVAAALARAMLPREAPDDPPAWLRADQRLSFRRLLGAVRRHRGALLADAVGSGKTYIALAVAAALEPGRPIQVLIPAVLRSQWEAAARTTRLVVVVHSHETLSRGRAPPPGRGIVIIDESHRFRTATIARYRTLAPWCVGRRGVLLTATPVVNRLRDLLTQLALLVRDDALAPWGIPSLASVSTEGPPGALAELVITGEDRGIALPARRERVIRMPSPASAGYLLEGIEALSFSRDPSIARLLRTTFLRALASSPRAVAAALSRYRTLLRHAEDVAASGRSLSRDAIRRFVGADGDQLVLWPMIAGEDGAAELDLADRTRLDALADQLRTDPGAADRKLNGLVRVLADSKPTLVFTGSLATAEHLRRGLRRPVAWCTGRGAGLDHLAMPREEVLDWFRRGTPAGNGRFHCPAVLVATDVAAEGLDLPLIERVVHYDLPWTAVRLEQRTGRALRLSSRHREVEVVRFLPTGEIAARLGQEIILSRKALLPAQLGLGEATDSAWRVRAAVAARWQDQEVVPGTAVVTGAESGVVVGIRLLFGDGTGETFVLARAEGAWTDAPAVIARLLEAAWEAELAPALSPCRWRAVSPGLAGRVSAALRGAHGAGIRTPHQTGRVLLRRLRRLAETAARERQPARLALLTRGIRHLRRGHTAGEALRIAGWAALSDPELLAAVERLPGETAARVPVALSLTGVLVVEARREPS